MKADKLDCAVSTTQGLYDSNYKLLSEEDYQKVGNFQFDVSRWTIFWSIIPLSSNPDISERINRIVKEKGGDAVINLQVTVSGASGGASLINFFSSAIPVLPGVVVATVSGDVVKVKK